MKRFFAILLSISLLLSLASCTERPDRVTDETLVSLRAQHPYNDVMHPSFSPDYRNFQTWTGFRKAATVYAVATLELTGDWVQTLGANSPLNDIPREEWDGNMVHASGFFHAAKLGDILWGGADLNPGEGVELFFGKPFMVTQEQLQATFREGERYVCFLYDSRENDYDIPAFYVQLITTWHLTEDEVLLCATDALACADDCSGMYLHAFAQNLTTYLGSPDTEPEAQTE